MDRNYIRKIFRRLVSIAINELFMERLDNSATILHRNFQIYENIPDTLTLTYEHQENRQLHMQ